MQWFRRLLSECGHELWIGDAARIRAAELRQQKTDRRDAELILKLMLEESVSADLGAVGSGARCAAVAAGPASPDAGADAVKNQLQSLALNQGLQKGRELWSEAGREQLRELPMMEHAARRRDQLLATVAELDRQIAELDVLVRRAGRRARRCAAADDASGSGSADGAGDGADAGRGEPVCSRPSRWPAIWG